MAGRGGQGSAGAEPIIPLDTLLELTSKADVDGVKFDGVDLWLADPHISIDSDKDQIKRVVDHIASYGLQVGSFVAPIWAGAGGGSAMGPEEERKRFISQVRKAAAIGQQMRELGIRPSGRHPHRLLDRRFRLGQGPRGQHQADRADFP